VTKSFESIAEMFLHRVSETPNRVAFRFPRGDGWSSYTWQVVGENVRQISGGLRALGLEPEQRCSIVCGTRVEWILADLGILCAGGATTTIYPSGTAADCSHILNDSNTVIAIAEGDDQVAKLRTVRDECPKLRNVINLDGKGSDDGWVIGWDEFIAKGTAADAAAPEAFESIARGVKKNQLATLIYTSGTTGRPKGVELTHDCWVFESEAIEAIGLLNLEDIQYLWLPLAHSFGKVLEAAQVRIGFETAVDGRVDKIVQNLGVIRPTFVAAVPRIFEKVHAKIVAGAEASGGIKLKIFHWAFGVGAEVAKFRQQGREPGGWLTVKHAIAHMLVFSKLHARFGGRLRYFVSGSAPLNRTLAEFFYAAGIMILEGYGLTESSAASFVNQPTKFRFGTVGVPVPGCTVKIADDGEILLGGRGIMRGYHNMPEATAEALDKDGWLHTGDIGQLEDGFLKITDRKKDLIKTSGGKYVAPQSLEGKLKVICPYISQVVVHGDQRNFVSMLIALDPEPIMKWAGDNGMAGKKYTDVVTSPEVRRLIEGFVDEMNRDVASFESVKKFAILPTDLTLESGDLTPSLKLKRKVVEQKYRDVLDGFYK